MRTGFLQALPLAFGVAAYGFAFGAVAGTTAFDVGDVALMGALVFAGSSQIVAVERLAAEASLGAALLAALALNLRYLAIMASIAPVVRTAPRLLQPLVAHMTADENWALTLSRRARGFKTDWRYLLGSGLAVMIAWVGASAMGTIAASSVPDLDSYGVGFAFTAAFIALARSMWSGASDLAPWLGAATITAAVLLTSGSTTLAVLCGGTGGAVVGTLLARPRPTSETTLDGRESTP